jgi:hypothetical protein
MDTHLISLDEPAAWSEFLARCGDYDSYHLPGYHQAVRQPDDLASYLFAFESPSGAAALPLVIRRIPGTEDADGGYFCDASSVYGYPGLVTSVAPSDPAAGEFRREFHRSLQRMLGSLRAITLFVRQNPLLPSEWLFDGLADPVVGGPTVAVDLRQPESVQFEAMARTHRYDIRKACRDGMTIREDVDFAEIDLFRRIYAQTMRRVGAGEEYDFSPEYFTGLRRHLGDRVRLFFAELDGRVHSAAIFLMGQRIIQYHLSGIADEFRHVRGGIRLTLDHVRRWGSENGFWWLHLGGGLGARQDSLFEFKAGFSPHRCAFRTVRLVADPGLYQWLARRWRQWVERHGYQPADDHYFPAYRQPLTRQAA